MMFNDASEGAIWPTEPVARLEAVVDGLLQDLWPSGPSEGGSAGQCAPCVRSGPRVCVEPAAALVRARGLLAQAERLTAAAALAVAEVDARELWALDAGGGTRSWLRSQACGDSGQLALGQRLSRWAGVRGAVLVGQIGARGALAVTTALEAVARLEADGALAEDQVLGVLVNGVPALLGPWCASSVVIECRTEQMDARLQIVTDTITACVADSSAPTGRRLEPALVLLARALGPGALTDALGTFLDALEPERIADRERRLWQNRSLKLSRRPDGGWDLRALLTEQTGHALHAALSALLARPDAADTATRSPGTAGPAGSQDRDTEAQDAAAAVVAAGTASWTDPDPDPDRDPDADPGQQPASAESYEAAPAPDRAREPAPLINSQPAAPASDPTSGRVAAQDARTGDLKPPQGLGTQSPAPADKPDGELVDPPTQHDPQDPPTRQDPQEPSAPRDPQDATPFCPGSAPALLDPRWRDGFLQLPHWFGLAGPGRVPLPPPRWQDLGGEPLEGEPERTLAQRRHDALTDLLHDLDLASQPPARRGRSTPELDGAHTNGAPTDGAPTSDTDHEPLLPFDPVAPPVTDRSDPHDPHEESAPHDPHEESAPPGTSPDHQGARTDRHTPGPGDAPGPAPRTMPPAFTAGARLSVAFTLAVLAGTPGVLPAQLDSGRGPVNLSPAALRRIGCHATLAAVLLDAHGRAVGASGEHRDATDRERRALTAMWGHTCAVNGCGSTRSVPHHVLAWHLARRTTLRHLLPLCSGHHHALHDEARTLRLRDGRLIDENGWTTQLPSAHDAVPV